MARLATMGWEAKPAMGASYLLVVWEMYWVCVNFQTYCVLYTVP